ncbi:hypothetical protein AB0C11_33720 [Streptomyces sp. NPDC039016]|uniref:hypothetical protein n=1 Tax=Streptomyces sp. NPDC039016 TaxID=3154330 RepID=UPI0033E08A77
MNHSLGVEIEATAKWLEDHGATGAAALLRRLARQRDEARQKLAQHAAEEIPDELKAKARAFGEEHRQLAEQVRLQAAANAVLRRDNAMLRTDLARLQVVAERAGWVPDAGPRRLWRWRQGWWELGHRKKNPKDGYHDTGWYLWGPDGSFGEWVGPHKAQAMTEADRLITKHLAAQTEGEQ